jgi:thiol:disulfide interchange protein DsbC
VDLQVDAVRESIIPGLYEVLVGAQVFYFSGDGRYLIQGDLVDLKERRSLTEPSRERARINALGKVAANDMLIYPARGERKHTITVFTDIDCGYCRQLHTHMDEMNARGIEVRYLMMPRAGLQSRSYQKAVSAWCADKPLEALTLAKQGQDPKDRECTNPVSAHMELAEALGINATPTIVTTNGKVVPGYMPPDRLLLELGRLASAN